jgi:hypothetical protein|tara:strand:+ start:583 stop:768 length:186 start_codon:yes stop_codon:yes gene_type:complete
MNNEKDEKVIKNIETIIKYIINNYDINEVIALLEEHLPESSDEEEETFEVLKDKDGFLSLK